MAPVPSATRRTTGGLSRASAPLGAELSQKAPIIGADPLLDETSPLIEPKDVHQVPHDALAVRSERPDRRLCELPDEGALDPRLTGNMETFDHDDAATNRSIVERRTDRPEVVGKAGVVGLEPVGPVEAEVLGGEVRVDLCLVLAGHLKLAGTYESATEVVSRQSHLSLLPTRGLVQRLDPTKTRLTWSASPSGSGQDRAPAEARSEPGRRGLPGGRHRRRGALRCHSWGRCLDLRIGVILDEGVDVESVCRRSDGSDR